MKGGVLFKSGSFVLAGLVGFVGVMVLLGYSRAKKPKAAAKITPEEMWQRHVDKLKALHS